MKKILIIGLLLLVILALSGCAPGPNELAASANAEVEPAGFLLGLWHGFISLFTFIVSLFNDNVNVYEVHNNGGWYNFGFLIGVSAFFGGGGAGSRKRK